jgi:phosphate transport system protein
VRIICHPDSFGRRSTRIASLARTLPHSPARATPVAKQSALEVAPLRWRAVSNLLQLLFMSESTVATPSPGSSIADGSTRFADGQENLIAHEQSNGDSSGRNHAPMGRTFDHELGELTARLLTMASHAERAVNDAVQALVHRDYDLAVQTNANDRILDRFEVEIDEMAIRLLTKSLPAGEVRLVAVAMKISQNLERIGDEAAKVAKRTRDLCQEPPVKVHVDLPRMAQVTLDMLKRALDSFVNRDPVAARAIIPGDKEVDQLNKVITRELVRYMSAHKEAITGCLNLMIVSKCLERIADHATNVAEEVVYLCEAQDIRHTGKAQITAGVK